MDYVLECSDKIVGQIVYLKTALKLDNGSYLPIMTVGPISIAPEYQRKGFGKILLDYTLEKAKKLGAGAVCFEGNIDFYGKSGFIVASKKKIHYHGEPREAEVPYFLLKELKEGYLDGVEGEYSTPNVYFVDEKEAEEFDKQFPYKEKKCLPGQIFN